MQGWENVLKLIPSIQDLIDVKIVLNRVLLLLCAHLLFNYICPCPFTTTSSHFQCCFRHCKKKLVQLASTVSICLQLAVFHRNRIGGYYFIAHCSNLSKFIFCNSTLDDSLMVAAYQLQLFLPGRSRGYCFIDI